MNLRAALPLLVVVLAALGPPATAEDDPRTVREGKHFRAVVHFESDAAADQALETVEALWPHVAKLYGLSQGKLEKLLEIHVYRDAADYEVAEEKLTRGAFKRNLAFAHFASQTAHVALQPAVSDEVLKAVGLPYLTRNLLLHEASHLVRYRFMANHRSHPEWFGDGVAMWLKYEALRSLGLITGLEADPASCTSIGLAQDAAERVDVERILDDGLGKEGFFTRYACKRLLVAHLMSAHEKAMRTFTKALKRMGGGGDFKARAKKALADAIGERPMADLGEAHGKFLRSLKPAWDEPLRSLETVGKDWLQIASANKNAVAWRKQPVGKKAYALSASLVFLRNYGKQANILLDKREEGFVSVAITAGFGVNVFAYGAKTNAWQSRASKELAGLDFDKRYDVRVEVDGSKVKVLVGEKLAVEVAFAERKGGLQGPWGLGAQVGSAIRWSDVKVR